MLRRISLFVALAAALIAQTPKSKPKQAAADKAPVIDKVKLEAYFRHLFVWPPPIQVTVSDPKPSPLPGFYEIDVRGSQGEASQNEEFYISSDGTKIIRGTVFDVTQNPFKSDLDKISTAFQPSLGTPGAPVVIVEFSDFECPFCRQEAMMLRQNLIQTYPKEVHFYFVDFPLESLHPWAKAAAMMGRCIFHQNADAFWVFHDWIFAHQEEITPDNLKEKVLAFAKDKGIDTDQLSKCIDSKATEEEVQRTRDEGHSLGVDQTPEMFVNGRRLVGTVSWDDLKRIIDYEIDYQKTAKNAGEDCGCSVTLPTPGMAPKQTPTGLHTK